MTNNDRQEADRRDDCGNWNQRSIHSPPINQLLAKSPPPPPPPERAAPRRAHLETGAERIELRRAGALDAADGLGELLLAPPPRVVRAVTCE